MGRPRAGLFSLLPAERRGYHSLDLEYHHLDLYIISQKFICAESLQIKMCCCPSARALSSDTYLRQLDLCFPF
jgi:hypothetical protein